MDWYPVKVVYSLILEFQYLKTAKGALVFFMEFFIFAISNMSLDSSCRSKARSCRKPACDETIGSELRTERLSRVVAGDQRPEWRLYHG